MELDPIEGEYKQSYKFKGKKTSNQESTKVTCPSCSAIVKSSDMNIQNMVAKCSSCHEVFPFQHVLQPLLDQSKKVADKPAVSKPSDVDHFIFKDELSMSVIDYNDWSAILAFTISSIGGMICMGTYFESGTLALPFVIAFALLFIFFIYRVINYKNNRRYIDVDDQYLYLKSRPKNFQKDKVYEVSRIKQFYLKSYAGSPIYCNLYMIYDGLNGEEHIKVTPYMKSRSRGLFLEQELENYLGIPDEPVADEIK